LAIGTLITYKKHDMMSVDGGDQAQLVLQITETLERLEGRLGSVSETLSDQRLVIESTMAIDGPVKAVREEHEALSTMLPVLKQALSTMTSSCRELQKSQLHNKRTKDDEAAPTAQMVEDGDWYAGAELEASVQNPEADIDNGDSKLSQCHHDEDDEDGSHVTWSEAAVVEEVIVEPVKVHSAAGLTSLGSAPT